jgi:hypothetical protein
MNKNEYVIGIKISTDKPLQISLIPEVIKEEILNGLAEILTAETYESWKEEQGRS